MAGSVNKAIVVGSLGRDPDVRTTQGGMKIVNLTVATSESWIDKASGERKEQTEWHRVVIMNENLANVADKHCHKGSKVYVEGKIQTRKWTDQGGTDRFTTEIMVGRFDAKLVVLDSKKSAEEPQRQAPARQSAPAAGADFDDEIPF